MRGWRFHRVAEHSWPGPHARKSFWNSEKAPLEKLKNLYVGLKRGPWRFWIWLWDLEWMETSILVFRAHLLKPRASSTNWTSHPKDAGLLQDREFESLAEGIVKKSTNKISPVLSEFSDSKKSSILIILCTATAGSSSLQSVSPDSLKTAWVPRIPSDLSSI